MRNPDFWLPPNGQSVLASQVIPNISGLASKSYSFPNYWVSATVCGPSRACLLTGLYSQQHCIFTATGASHDYDANLNAPPLLPFNSSPSWAPGPGNAPGFPSIANVLSQQIPVGNNASDLIHYDCTWLGKWHLGCMSGIQDGNPGENGPADYGFNSVYSLPRTSRSAAGPYPASAAGYPSPDGVVAGGEGGDFLDSSITQRNVVNFSTTINDSGYAIPDHTQINDAAVARAFSYYWLPNAETTFIGTSGNQLLHPWFCAVSFVNPHDITDFPFAFNLGHSDPANFGLPGGSFNPGPGFQPPATGPATTVSGNNCPVGGCLAAGDEMSVGNFVAPFTALPAGGGSSAPWNWEDPSLASMSWENNGKPDLQGYFIKQKVTEFGSVGNYTGSGPWPLQSAAWIKFLNYYYWMQSCVDYQVGVVLGTQTGGGNGLAQSIFANNTVVIFTSDHGDYGGSHNMHTKGGALYEEALNVPLYISYPGQRNNSSLNGPVKVPYVCSAVDLLPYLYTLALGNRSWRTNPNDMISHLGNREDIADGILNFANAGLNQVYHQRRISSIPLHNNVGTSQPWQYSQPFIVHTADDYALTTNAGAYTAGHAVAFRTVDVTDLNNNQAPFYGMNVAGGGKLGIYSYWNTCGQNTPPIKPTNTSGNQYEFYNYSSNPAVGSLAPNLSELGNQYFSNPSTGAISTQATSYLNDYNNPTIGSNIQGELYNLLTSSGNNNLQVQYASNVAYQNYRAYLNAANGSLTNAAGTPIGKNMCANSTTYGGPYEP